MIVLPVVWAMEIVVIDTATHCKTLQHSPVVRAIEIAVIDSCHSLPHPATPRHTLPHPATHTCRRAMKIALIE